MLMFARPRLWSTIMSSFPVCCIAWRHSRQPEYRPCRLWPCGASIAQWQSVGLVNQRSWVQSSLEAGQDFCSFHLSHKKTLKFWNVLVKACKAVRFFMILEHPFIHEEFSGVWKWRTEKREGPTEIWTRIAGFKVQSANHYTIGPGYESNAPKHPSAVPALLGE